ncbi:MAG: hypothetical protein ACRERU_11920 [Methylococcales bacterium]
MSQMATQNSSSRPQNPNACSELPFKLNDPSVSEWLENLPISDQIETGKTVFSTLRHLNRHSIETRARFAILEKFRTFVYWESTYLAARFTGTAFPLEQKARKIAKLAAKFHTELATGYQLIANHSEFEETYSNFEQAVILHRILRSIGISLLRIAQMYEPPSSKAWDLLKKLYREAESRQLLDIEIADPVVPFPDSSTIAGLLGTTILFTVSNPYRYSETEMDHLFRLFDAHSGKIEWRHGASDRAAPLFWLDLDNALPPQPGSPLGKVPNNSLKRIEASQFLAVISTPDTIQSQPLTAAHETTLATVLHHLGKPGKVRIKSLGMTTELTPGLEKIAALLKSKHSDPAIDRGMPSADWLVTPNFELLPITDDRSGRKISGRSNSTDRLQSKQALSTAQPKIGSDEIWGNSAQFGIGSGTVRCEVHPSELPSHVLVELKTGVLTIGQIVALQDPGSRIQIGVIRWMQPSADHQYFYYGVEHLTSKCSLANVFISSRKHADILLLEKNASGFSGYGIVMPPARYQSGTRLTVKQTGVTRNFVVERLLETNPFFCHYSLKQMHPADRPVQPAKAIAD